MDFLDHKHVLNIAHRGASRAAPPNTIAAFRAALEMGADGIELDVHLSADGVPVVIHDSWVDAATDGHGRVADLTVAQLKRLDAGTPFDRLFAGERIPLLEEVLDCAGDSTLTNIELKSTRLRDSKLEEAVVSLLKRHGRRRNVLLSSFNPLSLRRAKRLAPDIAIALIYSPNLPLPLRRAWLAPLAPHEIRHPEHTMVDEQYMIWAREHGYRVNAWTVDDCDEMARLIGVGVDGIITNVPAVLKRVIAATPDAKSWLESSAPTPSMRHVAQ